MGQVIQFHPRANQTHTADVDGGEDAGPNAFEVISAAVMVLCATAGISAGDRALFDINAAIDRATANGDQGALETMQAVRGMFWRHVR